MSSNSTSFCSAAHIGDKNYPVSLPCFCRQHGLKRVAQVWGEDCNSPIQRLFPHVLPETLLGIFVFITILLVDNHEDCVPIERLGLQLYLNFSGIKFGATVSK